MTIPVKFNEILKAMDQEKPDRKFSFGVLDCHLPDHNRIYCEEMVRQGKLASFLYCSDDGSKDGFGFKPSTLFYERGISIARRKVYTFRLPFFGAHVSFEHGGKVEYTWRGVKINKFEREEAFKKAGAILAELFKFYISFIRCWVAKNHLSYEDAYTILEHYSKNDGIITVPEFAEADFKKSLDVLQIVNTNSNFQGPVVNPAEFLEVVRDFMVNPVCINESFFIAQCPFCNTQAVSDGGIIECANCGRNFIGA